MKRRTYSVAETAEMLGVDPQTVRAYLAKGALTAVQPLGPNSRVLVVAESIDSLLARA